MNSQQLWKVINIDEVDYRRNIGVYNYTEIHDLTPWFLIYLLNLSNNKFQ